MFARHGSIIPAPFLAITLLTVSATVRAAEPVLFVSRPGQILRLADRNGDGDYLDLFEVREFAEGLSNAVGRIVATPDRVWVVVANPPSVLLIADSNRDGDALDFGEVVTYAQLPTTPPAATPFAAGIARLADGTLLVGDAANGELVRVADLNGDGDALDLGEVIVVAADLSQPRAMRQRSDGTVLVVQGDATIPVRILDDRNSDGDYLDFAENLSFIEAFAGMEDIATEDDSSGFLTRPGIDEIVRFHDGNADSDALDFNESLVFADGIDSPFAIARDAAAGGLFVATTSPSGTIYRVRDTNGDGDALDFGEAIVVATGITQMAGITVLPTASDCVVGDADGDGAVTVADVPIFSSALLGLPGAAPVCPIDMNSDGVLNGADVQPFVAALLP